MIPIEHKKTPLQWGNLDLVLFGIERDWYDTLLDVPAAFGCGMDGKNFWFIGCRRKPAMIHPMAFPGEFTAGLWKYDVAEFFLGNPESGRYLEFNLAPNGAWWSAEFTSPRVRADDQDIALPGVKTFYDLAEEGSWMAAACIPLEVLKTRFDFGTETRMNVTFIVDSPEQKFLTAAPAAEGEPNFHRPDLFQQIDIYGGGSI